MLNKLAAYVRHGPRLLTWALGLCAGTGLVSPRVGAVDVPGPYQLDPVCYTPAPRASLAPGKRHPGTIRMAERLAKIHRDRIPGSTIFFNDKAAESLAAALPAASGPDDPLRIRFDLARESMQAGRPDQALNLYLDMDRIVAGGSRALPARALADLRLSRAVAFLRLGEQENCIGKPYAESCLFPLSESARHHVGRGSRGAIEILSQILGENAADTRALWLLNIAYMTLGEYPDKVPEHWLIPPDTFASEHPMPRFPNVATEAGLDLLDLAGGVACDDFDDDGLLDVMASSWGLDGQLRFYHNNGDGTFVERTSEAGLVGLLGGLQVYPADYNNDGRLDLWIPRGAWLGKAGRIPGSLLRNEGHGTFADVTEEAGVLRARPTQACRWLDFDLDGDLDLFVGNETTDPNDPEPCELFRNNGDGTFTECAADVGLALKLFVKGVACSDYDNDGDPDLYLSVRAGPNVLLRNDATAPVPSPSSPAKASRRVFTDVSIPARVTQPNFSFATWFFDFDNDGWEDLFACGYGINHVGDVADDYLHRPSKGSTPRMYRNLGDGTFTNVTAEVGMRRVCHTMGCSFGDLDNDGWLDFYLATGDPDLATLIPNRMFRNDRGLRFHDVTTATGTGHLQKGHQVSFADLDNDGDQDVYVSLGGAYSGDIARNALFRNPGSSNRWVTLQLVGTRANRSAIGARLRVDIKTPAGPRSIHRTVGASGSFGNNPLRQEIGLGDALAIDKVTIQWPGDPAPQVVPGIEPGAFWRITQGTPQPARLAIKALRLGAR
ncbi:MAG: FG-GAP-like repeat-containing protein [Verrucomicrobiota bacterium]